MIKLPPSLNQPKSRKREKASNFKEGEKEKEPHASETAE